MIMLTKHHFGAFFNDKTIFSEKNGKNGKKNSMKII